MEKKKIFINLITNKMKNYIIVEVKKNNEIICYLLKRKINLILFSIKYYIREQRYDYELDTWGFWRVEFSSIDEINNYLKNNKNKYVFTELPIKSVGSF